MKVSYAGTTAYLEDEPLPDGSYVGTNKHSDLPVHLLWDEGREEWIQVCVREFAMPDVYAGRWVEVGHRPSCSCEAIASTSGPFYS